MDPVGSHHTDSLLSVARSVNTYDICSHTRFNTKCRGRWLLDSTTEGIIINIIRFEFKRAVEIKTGCRLGYTNMSLIGDVRRFGRKRLPQLSGRTSALKKQAFFYSETLEDALRLQLYCESEAGLHSCQEVITAEIS